MSDQRVYRDERTVGVENASYRWASLTFSYGLLLIAIYRSYALHQQVWDLLALVVIGGVVSSAYQARSRILTRRWLVVTLATIVIAAVVAAALVLL